MRFSHFCVVPGRDSLWRAYRGAQLVFGIFLAHGVLPTVRPAPGLVLQRSDLIQTTAGVLGATGISYRHSVEVKRSFAASRKKNGRTGSRYKAQDVRAPRTSPASGIILKHKGFELEAMIFV